MSYYDIRAECNGKTLILPSDPDRIVFVNHQNNRWEDGIIKSNHVKCGCETRFPSPANLGIRTSNDYDWFREQIEDSGQFDKCRRKLFSSKERYQCRACKSIWILGKPDREGCYLWCREEDQNI